jgi:pimeloyl-ACP methyl ester carboxylesterase
MTGSRRVAATTAAGMAALLALAVGPAPTTAAEPSSLPVVIREISFQVLDTNTSKVPCQSDGAPYTVAGHLVEPATQADAAGPARAAVLDLHGLGYAEFFWDFQMVPGYDWASALAERGISSVTIDRIGYGRTGKPPGMQSCLGAQADVAHQVVQELRSGTYAAAGGPAPSFSRVGLAGHSAGGAIAQAEAYSYHDVDALMVLSWADAGASLQALTALGQTGAVCVSGRQGQTPGYASFGQTKEDFRALMFHDADIAVVIEAVRLRRADPCGDHASLPATLLTDERQVPAIKVPVLLAIGDSDAIFPPPALDNQRRLYTGSDVTAIAVPNTGHALSLEHSAPSTRDSVASWLCRRSFCGG